MAYELQLLVGEALEGDDFTGVGAENRAHGDFALRPHAQAGTTNGRTPDTDEGRGSGQFGVPALVQPAATAVLGLARLHRVAAWWLPVPYPLYRMLGTGVYALHLALVTNCK